MHPQIQLAKPGQCPICGMKLIPLEVDANKSRGLREVAVSREAAARMKLETAPVERREVAVTIRMVGKVDYDETRVSYITAWIPGRLDRLFVDYTGVPVKKGDHMVSLYSPELISAQEELLQALTAARELEKSDVAIVRETTAATIEATREKLRLWGLTAAQIEAIEKRGVPDNHMTIYAPAGGVVIHKNAQEGMYVKTGTRIYTIADLSRVWVNLDAYESDLEWLRYGQAVRFTTEALPGETFAGRISFIHPTLDETSRTIKLRVNVANADGRLKPGMFVRAQVQSRLATGGRVMSPDLAGKWICPMHPDVVRAGAGKCDICGMDLVPAEKLGYVPAVRPAGGAPLVIPASAVLLTGTRAVVYVEIPGRKKPTYEGREIVLGPRAGAWYLVKNGIEEGERVVTNGAFLLDAELQIEAKPSMMTPEGGGGGGMAGMNHGGKKMTPDKMAAMTAANLKLPEEARKNLEHIIRLAEQVLAAAGSQPPAAAVQRAFGELMDGLLVVDGGKFPAGRAAALWREHAMLLANDAAEGLDAKTPMAAERAVAALRKHLAAARRAFGLGDMAGMNSSGKKMTPGDKNNAGGGHE